MSNNDNIIMDSDYNFSDAIAGTNAPLEIIDYLSMVDVCYFSFDGLRHQGQIIINSELEDDVGEIFALIEKAQLSRLSLTAGRMVNLWPPITPPALIIA